MSKARMISVLAGAALLMAGGSALSQPAAPAAAGDAIKGDTVFSQRCSGCHSAGSYNGDGTGPDLSGVVGRVGGSAKDFDYSPALKAYGKPWTPADLDTFLTNPSAMFPGSLMAVRVSQAQDRADVIAYLATTKAQ